jgi:ubiquinone/menaquinone biosynthesis C-methylase UbiE
MLNFLFKPKRSSNKYDAEINFWQVTIGQYVQWFNGEMELYQEKPPTSKQKIKGYSLQDSAILTWGKVHQEKKYLKDLKLNKNVFKGKKLLDIGSGPHPSAMCFKEASLYCLDPLFPKYLEIGFPIHYYDNVKFVYAKSENIPFSDKYFDAIISVNAIDHVDDIEKTAEEISRVLKPNGKLRMHVHYHKKTLTEPIELSDKRMNELFSWCKGFGKVDESKSKTGFTMAENEELYALWSN